MNAEKVVEILNRALSKDPVTVSRLFSNRLECNDELADDEAIVVCMIDGRSLVGPLGIINALIEGGPVAAQVDTRTGEVVGFQTLN